MNRALAPDGETVRAQVNLTLAHAAHGRSLRLEGEAERADDAASARMLRLAACSEEWRAARLFGVLGLPALQIPLLRDAAWLAIDAGDLRRASALVEIARVHLRAGRVSAKTSRELCDDLVAVRRAIDRHVGTATATDLDELGNALVGAGALLVIGAFVYVLGLGWWV